MQLHYDFEHFQYWKDTTLTLENTFPYSFHCSNSSENQNLNTISLKTRLDFFS